MQFPYCELRPDTFYNKYLYFSDNHVPKSPRRGQISYQIRINSKKSTFESMYRTVQNLQASHHFLAENQVLCSFCNTVNIPSTFYYVCGTTCFLIKSIVNPRSSKQAFFSVFLDLSNRKWPEVPTDIKIQPSSLRAFYRGV